MSCGPSTPPLHATAPIGIWASLSDEGFRLFFPLSAVYAALWPLIWVLVHGFDLPLAATIPPALWHGHEMLTGAFGAALIGFLTTAAPEWTDSPPLKGRSLWSLAVLWATGRTPGLLGWDTLSEIGVLADFGWMSALLGYLVWLSWENRTDRLLGFVFWLALLLGCELVTGVGFLTNNVDLASLSVQSSGLVFLGLLGLALGRITVPVTNLVLDPTERTSPFRPHPGRLHLAPGLILVALLGDTVGVSPSVSGFLFVAAGAAFLDRVAEAFIGSKALQSEILMLAGSSALAGAGLVLTGCARLGAPWTALSALHLAYLGGLGLGVFAVFCIAGKLHTGRPLGQYLPVRLGAACLCLSVALRCLPDLGVDIPGPLHALAAIFWAAAFLTWLIAFWPALRRVGQSV